MMGGDVWTIIVWMHDWYAGEYKFTDFEQYSIALSDVLDTDDPPVWWVFECDGKIIHLLTEHIRVIETTGKAPENWGNDDITASDVFAPSGDGA